MHSEMSLCIPGWSPTGEAKVQCVLHRMREVRKQSISSLLRGKKLFSCPVLFTGASASSWRWPAWCSSSTAALSRCFGGPHDALHQLRRDCHRGVAAQLLQVGVVAEPPPLRCVPAVRPHGQSCCQAHAPGQSLHQGHPQSSRLLPCSELRTIAASSAIDAFACIGLLELVTIEESKHSLCTRHSWICPSHVHFIVGVHALWTKKQLTDRQINWFSIQNSNIEWKSKPLSFRVLLFSTFEFFNYNQAVFD
jgi:hypothetical protein